MKRYFLLIVVLYTIGCTNTTNYTRFLQPLMKNVNAKTLERDGFKRVWGVDVLLYEKQIVDTIYHYQFVGRKGNKLAHEWWTINNFHIPKESFDFYMTNHFQLQQTDFDCNNCLQQKIKDNKYILLYSYHLDSNSLNIEYKGKVVKD